MLDFIHNNFNNALLSSLLTAALMTDLSKTFDCLLHGILITKLAAYGFDYGCLKGNKEPKFTKLILAYFVVFRKVLY